MKSWLADVTNVRELGPFGQYFVAHREQHQPDSFERGWDRELRTSGKWPPTEPGLEFFRFGLHDSWVDRAERHSQLFSLHVLHDISYDLAKECAEDQNREVDCRPIVELQFLNPTYVRAARAMPDGGLVYADLNELGQGEGRDRDMLYGGYFTYESGRVQWISMVRTWRRELGLKSDDLYLLVDCSGVGVVDRREAILTKCLGPDVLPAWRDALEGM